jgi:hypothetical protein
MQGSWRGAFGPGAFRFARAQAADFRVNVTEA